MLTEMPRWAIVPWSTLCNVLIKSRPGTSTVFYLFSHLLIKANNEVEICLARFPSLLVLQLGSYFLFSFRGLMHACSHTHILLITWTYFFLFAIKEIKFSFKPADTDHILEESSGNQQLMSCFLNSKRNHSRPWPVCQGIAEGWVLWG